MLVDVLMELNNLSKRLQEYNVYVTSLGIAIDHTLNTIHRYLCSPYSFAKGAVHLTKFLENSKDGFLEKD